MSPEPVANPPAAPAPQPAAPQTKTAPSALRIRTNVRAGGNDNRLFDSQNNANGFWDEDGDE